MVLTGSTLQSKISEDSPPSSPTQLPSPLFITVALHHHCSLPELPSITISDVPLPCHRRRPPPSSLLMPPPPIVCGQSQDLKVGMMKEKSRGYGMSLTSLQSLLFCSWTQNRGEGTIIIVAFCSVTRKKIVNSLTTTRVLTGTKNSCPVVFLRQEQYRKTLNNQQSSTTNITSMMGELFAPPTACDLWIGPIQRREPLMKLQVEGALSGFYQVW